MIKLGTITRMGPHGPFSISFTFGPRVWDPRNGAKCHHHKDEISSGPPLSNLTFGPRAQGPTMAPSVSIMGNVTPMAPFYLLHLALYPMRSEALGSRHVVGSQRLGPYGSFTLLFITL